jgi:NAD(P)-dependent dehydrogenase (short-subunit alcohol dehydrogenase family)
MSETKSMAGKTCLVTGAAAGIGNQAALGFAKLGATVIALARDPARGQKCVEEIRSASGNPDVHLALCDLASQDSIRSAAAEIKKRHPKIHVLFNQAGIYSADRKLTKDGLELMFAVNHLAYFQLTLLLIDQLKAGAPARIINGTGAIEGAGRINFDDLQGEKKFSAFKALAQSKLGNLLFTMELARRLEGTGITVTCFHPGGVKTSFGTGEGGLMGVIMSVARMFGSTPASAAKIPIHLATAAELEKVTGQYFNLMKPAKPSKSAQDPALAKRLWEVSEKLTGARL